MRAHRHRRTTRPSLPDLAARLRTGARKLTGQRQAVLEALRRAAHPLSSQQLFRGLKVKGCDLATVYRALHVLEQLGMVKRFDLGDGVARFELLRAGDDGHHHHLVCTNCAEVVEIDECETAEFEARLAARSGFVSVTHKLEFFGVCPACQKK